MIAINGESSNRRVKLPAMSRIRLTTRSNPWGFFRFQSYGRNPRDFAQISSKELSVDQGRHDVNDPALFDQSERPFLQSLLVCGTRQQENFCAVAARVVGSVVGISVEGRLHFSQICVGGGSIPFAPFRKYVEQPLRLSRGTHDDGAANSTPRM